MFTGLFETHINVAGLERPMAICGEPRPDRPMIPWDEWQAASGP